MPLAIRAHTDAAVTRIGAPEHWLSRVIEYTTMTADESGSVRSDEQDRIDSADKAAYLTRALARFDPLNKEEAQAFVYREILAVSRQRTAEETGMSTADIRVNLVSAQTKITDARQTIELIDKYAS